MHQITSSFVYISFTSNAIQKFKSLYIKYQLKQTCSHITIAYSQNSSTFRMRHYSSYSDLIPNWKWQDKLLHYVNSGNCMCCTAICNVPLCFEPNNKNTVDTALLYFEIVLCKCENFTTKFNESHEQNKIWLIFTPTVTIFTCLYLQFGCLHLKHYTSFWKQIEIRPNQQKKSYFGSNDFVVSICPQVTIQNV